MNFGQLVRIFVVIVVPMLNNGHAMAVAWQQTNLFNFTTEYDSNPAMSATTNDAILRYIAEPGLTLTSKVEENEFNTGISLQVVRSSNETLNPGRESPTAFADWLRHFESSKFESSTINLFHFVTKY